MMNSTLTNITLTGFTYKIGNIVLISNLFFQFLLGVSLHCYIIFLLLCRGRGVGVSVVFMLNHVFADILFSIAAPLSLSILVFLHVSVDWLNSLTGTSLSARLLFLCCVCLERYQAVVHPLIFLRLKLIKYRVVCSVLVWICSVLLGISLMTIEPFKILMGVFLITLAVEFFCGVSILKKLRDPGPRDMRSEQGEMNVAKKKAFQIVFINLLTCLAQNVPIAVSYIIPNIQLRDEISIVHVICATINIFSGFIQPFMILHKAGKLPFFRCF